ncbi:MAG: class A beta-lactamase-related serine hydrolase [Bacteroidetes bacterium]|nr:MAG: class A beta-lactamase-related serine hydrolase [Bacteroidota bacterium]
MIRLLFAMLLFGAIFSAPGCTKSALENTGSCTVENDSSALHPRGAQFQVLLDEYTSRGLPGISLLVRDSDGRWAGASGMADIGAGVAMRPCHVSKIASVTKLFIGVLVMKLVETGVLDLDAPISTWVPGHYIDKIANARESTLRMLLNHSSGIADVIEDQQFYLHVLNDPDKHWTEEELLDFVCGDEPQFSPAGDSVEYSNTNLLLAALIIEKATGLQHHELLRTGILLPLGLSNTYYQPHDPLPPFTAHGYFDLYNNNTLVDMSSFNTGSGNGYGGMFSNVFDMQTFIEALLRSKTLLSPAALQEMETVRIGDEAENEFYGVTLRREYFGDQRQWTGYGHRGRDLAYSADLYYFPEQDITMALIVNYGTDGESDLRELFLEFRKNLMEKVLE